MKQLAILACVLALTVSAWASDHGPVFGYAMPVNSQGEFSFDSGLFWRYGSRGTQFGIAGVLIACSFLMTYAIAPRLRNGEQCDADDPNTCGEVSRISRVILWCSAVIYAGGFFVAYLLGPILVHLDR